MKVGIVGCGVIGAEIAMALAGEGFHSLELTGLHDANILSAEAVSNMVGGVRVLPLEGLVATVDLVVQATTADTMPTIVRSALNARCHVVAMSAGGLARDLDLLELATQVGCRIYLPSGAIAGIDAVLAAREAGLTAVSLTTTKHPRSLAGAPYLARQSIDLEFLKERTILFEGSAREAIQGFPANSNVAITLSFAGLGMDATQVKIVADPAATFTQHEVRAQGAAGKITAITECAVSPWNPKTSHLASMSALALLRSFGASLCVGT